MFENVADLGAVQLGIDKHGGEARVPNPVKRFEISDAILCNNRDAVAGYEFTAGAQRAAEACGAGGERAIIEDHLVAETDGRTGRMAFPRTFEPQCKIHGRINAWTEREGCEFRRTLANSRGRCQQNGSRTTAAVPKCLEVNAWAAAISTLRPRCRMT